MFNRTSYYESVFEYQIGEGFDFPVYQGIQFGYGFNVYHGRSHYKARLGNILRGIRQFFRPVAMSKAKSPLQAGSEALKD